MIRKAFISISVGALLSNFLIGCAVQKRAHTHETGYQNWQQVQVQFFAPPGATVTVGKHVWGRITSDRAHQVSTYGDGLHKLEHTPEQFAVFNLAPGTYEFKYQDAGWADATLYGELEIRSICPIVSKNVKKLLKRSFIPIALPGPATVKTVSAADDLFPYQSSAKRLKISYQDVERLAAGDMVTKVVFVADLKEAEENRDELEIDLVELSGKRKRLQGLLNEAQLDWLEKPSSKKFIRLQTDLAKLDQKIRDKTDAKDRLEALLRADKVLITREMVAMATDELLPKHEDPVVAAKELGEVLLVLRIGGRHLHWQ